MRLRKTRSTSCPNRQLPQKSTCPHFCCDPQSRTRYFIRDYNTRRPHFPYFFLAFQTVVGLPYPRVHSCRSKNWSQASKTGFKRFPFNNFTYCLTLFSKFFSSFPHGTCSLSVSRQYLALDEIYHPFRTAFPSYPTLRTQTVRGKLRVKDGILTLYDALFQGTFASVLMENVSSDYNSGLQANQILNLSSSRFTRRY